MTLRLGRTGRTLGSYSDLTSAEAKVWAQYLWQRGRKTMKRAQRATDVKGP